MLSSFCSNVPMERAETRQHLEQSPARSPYISLHFVYGQMDDLHLVVKS